MGFAQRLEVAKSFEMEVERYLCGRTSLVAKNGTEHTHPDFTDKIRFNSGRGAKFVRFAPDGVYLSTCGSVIHWEAKAGKHIEKDAYETYMAYNQMGCTVILFVRAERVYCQRVERVGFIPSIDVVGKFAPARRHPIDEDDWICPRGGHGYAGTGSGTPYREIDLSSMRVVSDFDQVCGVAA